ncbi:APC family permease [Conexibacter woesei]|uniref:Amino acid permease-associated region n=1 Tax=Conexibacter woesei (strain DSM 14684 / CCUG 47730 / CIP 108061 / JCM 11494 / NBRC 100937 / ID131577) TaxID=469383 RepID=D3FC40_CONWI|nr:APC family permease [Conexibacter woesei]ADB53335.1 amino acid permease-associated region [Conexibacter woesei DSM 14684]
MGATKRRFGGGRRPLHAGGTAGVEAEARERAEAPGGLKKAIGRNMLLFFVVGDVLGAGIYALVGEVGGRVGGAIWTSFAVALALAFLTAFAYAELVTKYPRAAGAALYVNKAFRMPFLTFLVAFAVMCSGITSAATLSTAFGGDYLKQFLDVPTVMAGLVFIIVVALINFRGISESVKLNIGLTCIELGGLLLITVIAAAAVLNGDGDAGRALDFKEGETVPIAILAGAALAFYALIGFEDSVNVAEETEQPQRDYPRALFGGLLAAGVVYLTVTVLASMAVPTDRLASSTGPLLEVAQVGPLSIDPKVFAAIALFAVANGALINMIMASRLVYGMSREGIVPRFFGGVHKGRQTPLPAIVFTTALCMLLIAIGTLEKLADTTVTLLLCVFILVNVSVLVLRRDPVDHDHFHAPSAIPVIGAVVCATLLTQQPSSSFPLAGGLMALGVVLYFVSRRATGPTDMDTGRLEAVEHPR